MFIPFHTCHQEAFLALSPPGKQIKTTWTWCKKHWMLGPWCCRSWSCHLRQHSCPVATFPTKPSEIANEIQKKHNSRDSRSPLPLHERPLGECHNPAKHGDPTFASWEKILPTNRSQPVLQSLSRFSIFLADEFFSSMFAAHMLTWSLKGDIRVWPEAAGSCAASASYLNFPEISKTRPPAVHLAQRFSRHRMITGWLAWWHSKNSGTNQLPQSLRWLPMGKPSPNGQKAGMSAWCQYGMPNAKASASVELFLIQNLSFQINKSHIVTYNSSTTFDVLNPFSWSLLHIELPV